MRTKLFALVGILLASVMNASAAGESMFAKGHSTWTVIGMTCATAVATDITASLPGFNINSYRLSNSETSFAVYIGGDSGVSVDPTNLKYGEKIAGGGNGVWELGTNPDQAHALVKIWCKAAAAAGNAGVRISRAVFGSK